MEEYLQAIIYQNKCTQQLLQGVLLILGVPKEQLEKIRRQIQRDVEKEMEDYEKENENGN